MTLAWSLMLTLCANCGGDPGINPMWHADRTQVFLAMPSQEVCVAIAKLNPLNASCWAQPIETMPEPTCNGGQPCK